MPFPGLDIPVRAFATELADLGIDLGDPAPARAATQVIVACAGILESAALQMTVSRRIVLLLAIAQGGGKALTAAWNCAHCGEWIEVEFTLEELADYAPLEDEIAVDAGFRLRLPTGADQMAWIEDSAGDLNEASLLVLGSLVGDEATGWGRERLTELLPAAERALEEHDPLVDFAVDAQCPECGSVNRRTIDWTAYALSAMSSSQRELVETIHRLAGYYHWSEAEIMAIPAWRRALYLEAVDQERG